MSAFLILGHGSEDTINFERRSKLPKGYTLVTLAKCGVVTKTNQICPITSAFLKKEYEPLILDPKKNRSIINTFLKEDIHVYTEGDYYPKLSVQLFTDLGEDDEEVILFKSGVYKFPTSIDDFEIDEGDTPCEKSHMLANKTMMGLLKKDFDTEALYRGSIFPTVEEASTQIANAHRDIQTIKKNITFPLEEIFQRGGPGVYYYVVCRHPKGINQPKTLITNLGLNEKTYKKFNSPNWISNLNTLIPMLEEEKTKHTNTSYSFNRLGKTISKYKNLKRVPAIRRASIAQQEGTYIADNSGVRRGGKSRSHHKRRQCKKTQTRRTSSHK